MTATSHITLWCDGPQCMTWTDHGRSSLRDTRQLARDGEGWTSRSGLDFCSSRCFADWKREIVKATEPHGSPLARDYPG